MSKKQKKNLTRIIVALIAYIVVILLVEFIPLTGIVELVLYLAVGALIGWDVIWKAIRNISHGQIFDENFLMTVAAVGAFCLGEYKEAIAVLLFYQVGEWFQSYAVGKSRKSIAAAMDIRPEFANIQQADGSLKKVSPEEVQIGDIIAVKPGERVPLDGEIVEGTSALDTSALTGESVPRDVEVGQEVISGCINLTGILFVRVEKVYGESTVAKILDLVENSSAKKAKAENFITRFARYYTPIVCIAALILAVVPPLITGDPFSEWIYRALTFLVISCPCALVISVPLSFFGGIGGISKLGVMVKGSNYIEVLSKMDVVVFDKTGTLTKGSFEVTEICAKGIEEQELLELVAYAENYSSHPIAQSVLKSYGKEVDTSRISEYQELAGRGIKVLVDGKQVLAGNEKLMQEFGVTGLGEKPVGTTIYLSVEGEYKGYVLLEDEPKKDAKQAIKELKAEGIRETVMLTGDSAAVGEKVANNLGIDVVYTQLMPADKVEKVEELLANKGKNSQVAFVGDGINDAPVLARADVGIAMGGLGSDAAIEAADVVIMNDEPSRIPAIRRAAQKTMRIVRQNIVFALGIKLIVLVLGALGIATMWAAVFADVGVSVIAILNAMRALQVPKDPKDKD